MYMYMYLHRLTSWRWMFLTSASSSARCIFLLISLSKSSLFLASSLMGDILSATVRRWGAWSAAQQQQQLSQNETCYIHVHVYRCSIQMYQYKNNGCIFVHVNVPPEAAHLYYLEKRLPWVCCVALLCCLYDLACFFLPTFFISLTCMTACVYTAN